MWWWDQICKQPFCCIFSGLVIYFCYGIHHSTEGSLARSSPETELNGYKASSEAMSTEKEAFLPDDIDARDEDL